jgi:hypothetical protein
LLTARSAFYALPFYLLIRAGGLWLVAALQAMAAAWTVQVVSRALVPAMSGLAYLALVAALTGLTSLGFEAAYAMPDLFGGLALLAAGALIACPDRFGLGSRLGLCALMTYAALAHTENNLNLAAAAALCVAFYLRAGPASFAVRTGPIVASLGVALALSAGGGLLLNGVFGRPVHMAPFAASRVLADGGAQLYLRQTCQRDELAACDLADAQPVYLEYYLGIYPLERPPILPLGGPARLYDQIQFRSVSDAEAAHRERFVAEQGQLVLGALAFDAPNLLKHAFSDGAATFTNFGVNRDFDSLQGLLREHTQRRDQIVAITPNAPKCVQTAGQACGALEVGALAAVQGIVVWASFALLAVGGLLRPAAETGDRLRIFAVSTVCLVLVNALICGGLSGPYDRYQSRVEWLIPLCALLGLFQWARRRATAGLAAEATIPSPVATIVAATSAARRS